MVQSVKPKFEILHSINVYKYEKESHSYLHALILAHDTSQL